MWFRTFIKFRIFKVGAIIVYLTFAFMSSAAKGANPAFDRIRPIAADAADALQEGDSLKALSLYTEALVRGQEWQDTPDEQSLMAEIIGNLIPLRESLCNENLERLMLELMMYPATSSVNRDIRTFGGHPEIVPSFDDNERQLTSDSLSSALVHAVDLMATDRLKECERLLISLYQHTWKNGLNADWRHPVANKLGLLYIKLGTLEQAIDILRQNKIDMDPNIESYTDYAENLFYLSYALMLNDTKIIWKCHLETANELARQNNLNLDAINADFSRIFLTREDISISNAIAEFIHENDKNLCFLTESQREERWNTISNIWKELKKHLIDSVGNVKDINACLNAFQYEKQIMLRSATKTIKALKEAGDEEAIMLTDSLIKTRQKLAECLSLFEDDLLAEYERIQKVLLHHHTMTGFEDHLFKFFKTSEIANLLEDNETFIDFGILETDIIPYYYAILISRVAEKGTIIPLCSVDEITSFITNTEDSEAKQMVTKRYGNDFLFEKIWKPIFSTGLLNERIYYCPVGELSRIMPEAISYKGQYLGETLDFHILSSAEALSKAKAGYHYRPEKINSFCAIDYYCDRNALLKNARQYGAKDKPRLLEMDYSHNNVTSLPPLHTPQEFNWLYKLGNDNQISTCINTDYKASEYALKYLSGKDIGVLNIVTHAFSFPSNVDPKNNPYLMDLKIKRHLNQDYKSEIRPLYRTGLMLSGADRVWNRHNVITDIEDGVVNGAELAALDLHGVDLLTLIACDTGNGDIDPEEGILGLRRALKLAGCKTIVTTAWNLDKEAGDAYLQEFYTNLINGSGIHAAHRMAQLELLKRFDNPYYWAVFQLID